jgi:hypothetical protein
MGSRYCPYRLTLAREAVHSPGPKFQRLTQQFPQLSRRHGTIRNELPTIHPFREMAAKKSKKLASFY